MKRHRWTASHHQCTPVKSHISTSYPDNAIKFNSTSYPDNTIKFNSTILQMAKHPKIICMLPLKHLHHTKEAMPQPLTTVT